jgi:hypothetical protein
MQKIERLYLPLIFMSVCFVVCHSGVRMKRITVSYFKMEIGRIYYNDLEEIHFRNVGWTELTRDEDSNFETWQWMPSKRVLCV